MDTKPLAGSMNPITSNAVYEALEEKLGTEGGALTGPLELPGDPEEENQAASKGYVDDNINAPHDQIILNSSTAESTKKFSITVDDDGTISAEEITEETADDAEVQGDD